MIAFIVVLFLICLVMGIISDGVSYVKREIQNQEADNERYRSNLGVPHRRRRRRPLEDDR